jgi:hypothetical protein
MNAPVKNIDLLEATTLIKAPVDLTDPSVPDAAYVGAHLAYAEQTLRARDISGLTDEQRRRRAIHLDRLREYRLTERFPKNTDFPGLRVPYFRDAEGTLCAMAHLIQESGHAEFVDRVATEANNAKVAELASDPTLVAWLDAEGLSVEEAALVQPTYRVPSPQVGVHQRLTDETINKARNDRNVRGARTFVMNKSEAGKMRQSVLSIRENSGMWRFPTGYKSQMVKELLKLNREGTLKLTKGGADTLNKLRGEVTPKVRGTFKVQRP